MKATNRIFNRAMWRVVALLGLIAALAAPPAFAQHHDTAARAGLQSLTFARHVDTPFTLATAQTAMANANTVVQTCDGTPNANEDVACQVTMQVSGGSIGTFGATMDGGDMILTNAQMNTLINSGTANVLVVTAIGFCGGPPAPGLTIIGCGNVGARGIVSVNALPGNQLGVEVTHEFLHNQGHEHRGCQNSACTVAGMAGTQQCNCCTGAGTGTCAEGPMTPGAILNPVLDFNSNIINQAECASLHTGPSYVAADNGPIVDPPPTISCPAGATVECTSPAGTPQTSAQIAALLAGVTASDGCEPTPTVTNNAPSLFPMGTTAVTFSATDVDFLGATSTCNTSVRVVDTTPPAVVASLNETVLWPPDHNLVNVGLSAIVSDTCDPNPTISVIVFGDETDEEPMGDGNFSPDAKNLALGTLLLREERKGNADGRVYLIVVKAMDASGNVGVDCATVVVPHDRSGTSTAFVNAQAGVAKAFCLASGGSSPPGYFVVGDGPIIGPKQ